MLDARVELVTVGARKSLDAVLFEYRVEASAGAVIVTTGGVTSTTVNAIVQDATLPAASIAVTVTVWAPRPICVPAMGLCVTATGPLQSLAEADLSPMAQGFYSENRRVANGKAKRVLGWAPSYPTYREGLRSLV